MDANPGVASTLVFELSEVVTVTETGPLASEATICLPTQTRKQPAMENKGRQNEQQKGGTVEWNRRRRQPQCSVAATVSSSATVNCGVAREAPRLTSRWISIEGGPRLKALARPCDFSLESSFYGLYPI